MIGKETENDASDPSDAVETNEAGIGRVRSLNRNQPSDLQRD